MMTSPKDNIVDLMKRQRQTRAEFLQELFEEHVVALRHFIRGHMASEADREDIVQEVFARLMSLDDLEAKMSVRSGSNRAFILSMANSIIVDQERHKRVCRNYNANQKLSEADRVYEISPEHSAVASRDLEIIKSVILEMRPRWRKAFILNRFKHMSYRQVADAMGVSQKQVEHYLANAMGRIRQAERLIKRQGEGL